MMVTAPPKPRGPPVIQRARILEPNNDPRLLEPGWTGQLDDDELVFIRAELVRDRKLAARWGFRPGQKTRPDEAIRRVAMDGDPDGTAHNRRLARPRKRGALAPLVDLSKLRT